jgi:hypothetical protein
MGVLQRNQTAESERRYERIQMGEVRNTRDPPMPNSPRVGRGNQLLTSNLKACVQCRSTKSFHGTGAVIDLCHYPPKTQKQTMRNGTLRQLSPVAIR